MVQTNNPYEKLVDYFDKQIVKEKKPPAKELQPKKVQEVEQIDTKQIIQHFIHLYQRVKQIKRNKTCQQGLIFKNLSQ